MFRAMIVDDENMICELIRRLIDWESHDIQLIGTAHDGESALALAEQGNPDIVITDIRIPKFDGLELIRRAQLTCPRTHFIVISGYRQFDYAHSAMRYGVKDYLLKPVNAGELSHALRRLIADITRERNEAASKALLSAMSEKLSIASVQIRQQFLNKLIERRLDPQELTLDELNRKYEFSLAEGPIRVFIIKASCLDLSKADLLPLVLSRTALIVQQTLQSSCPVLECAARGSQLYCLVQCHAGEDALDGLLQRVADQFDAVSGTFEDFILALCTADSVRDVSALPQAVSEAERAVSLRFLAVPEKVVDGRLSHKNNIRLEDVFPRGQHTVFLQTVQSGDSRRVDTMLRQIFAPIQHAPPVDYDPAVPLALCRQILQVTRFLPEYENVSLSFAATEQAMDLSHSVRALTAQFRDAYIQDLEPYFTYIASKSDAPIQKATKYVEKHYAEPLTLPLVAAQANLSPAYLSTIFKKETGSSFNEYLTLCRMNAAKQLLRSTELPIAEVAERTGYMDAKYFSKVFAKSFGIPPQKYRKI